MDEKIRERKVYFFQCAKCGKARRQTFRKSKAVDQLCRKCRVEAIRMARENINQMKLI